MGVGAGLYMCDVVKKVHVRYLISWWVLVKLLSPTDLKFLVKPQWSIPLRTSNASPRYLVKYLLKNQANSHARLSRFKTAAQKSSPLMLATFCSLMKRYLQWPHRTINRMTDCTVAYTPTATGKKDVATNRLRTRLTFSHWWHQSASH